MPSCQLRIKSVVIYLLCLFFALSLPLLLWGCDTKSVDYSDLELVKGKYVHEDELFCGKVVLRNEDGNKSVESLIDQGIVLHSDYFGLIEDSLSSADYIPVSSQLKEKEVYRIQLVRYQEAGGDPIYFIDVICKSSLTGFDSFKKKVLSIPEVKKYKINSIVFKPGEIEESFHKIELGN